MDRISSRSIENRDFFIVIYNINSFLTQPVISLKIPIPTKE